MQQILAILFTTGAFLTAPAALANNASPIADENLENWEVEPLYDDWPMSTVMGDSVFSRDDERVGRINDILISENGHVEAIIVQQREEFIGWRYYKVLWQDIDFDPLLTQTVIALTAEQVAYLPKEPLPYLVSGNQFEASDLLGMPVNLDNSRPYGEIDNLLIDPGSKEITAFIVESDGKGYRTYALPADFNAINRDAMRADFSYVVDDVAVIGVFYVDPADGSVKKTADMDS